jgi:trigger factor
VKTDVEELSPTRVRLSVEVPFEELKPSLDKAYREIAQQVRIPGFRPGKAPRQVIDTRVGRDYVLSQAVNEALPGFYDKAVADNEIAALGTPEVDVSELDYGKQITFTVEVDVSPTFELPELATLTVEVDGTKVSPDEVEDYISALRERFASLKGVQRPAENGDFTSIDLSATVDGESVEDAQAYEIGSESLLDGLDEALTGMEAGDVKTFTTELAGGEKEGQQAEVTVTVQSVKTKELPELDDDFAQLASEYDTLGEMRAGTRKQIERMKKLQQVMQARDKSVQALLDAVQIPLPEGVVQAEIEHNMGHVKEQLDQASYTMGQYLAEQGKTQEQFETEIEEQSRKAVKLTLVLDKLIRQEEVKLTNEELSAYVAQQAERMGVSPQRLAQELTRNGQINSIASSLLRDKSMTVLAEKVKVTDPEGVVVDVKSVLEAPAVAAEADQAEADEAEADETEADEAVEAIEAEEAAGTEETDAE